MRPFRTNSSSTLIDQGAVSNQCTAPITPAGKIFWRLWGETLPPHLLANFVVGNIGEEGAGAGADRRNRVRVRDRVGVTCYAENSRFGIEGV